MKRYILLIFVLCTSLSFTKELDLTLSNAIDMANKNDYTLKNSTIEIENSNLKVKEAYKEFLPKIDAKSTVDRNEKEVYNHDSDKTNFENNISLTQPVYSGGSLMASLLSEKKNLKISELNQQITKDNLRIEVITKYIDILKEIQNKILYERSHKEIQDQYDLANNKYKLGLVPLTEVLPLKTNLININTQIIKTQSFIDIYKSDLKNILGINRATKINLVESKFLVKEFDEINLKNDINNSRENSREVKVSNLNIDVSKENEKKSFSNFLPKVDLNAGYTAEDQHLSDSADQWNWNVGMTIKMNIFSFGEDVDAYKRSKNVTKQYINSKLETQDDLETEIRNNYLTLITSKRTVEENISAVESAKENVLLERGRYRNNLTNAVDYLQIENSFIESEIALSNSKLDYYLAYEVYLNSLK